MSPHEFELEKIRFLFGIGALNTEAVQREIEKIHAPSFPLYMIGFFIGMVGGFIARGLF